MRTQKGNTHYYYDSGNNLVGMTDGTHTLLFYHDENGSPIAFSYNGVMYYYIKNLQGDVMKIVNYNGVTIASYSYDVSGKVLSVKNSMGYDVTNSATHIGNISPFRYRGYVYDFETGLYYLQSRYYDPVTTRFINADVYCDTDSGSPLSANMFSYCENNAVIRLDGTGNWFSTLADYARYKNQLYEMYLHYDAYYGVSAFYREQSHYYGNLYAIAKNRYKGISERYKKNLKKVSRFNTYIFGQINSPYGNFIFGASNVGRCGCGAVALFNVLFRLGKTTHLAEIIMILELNYMLSNNGAGGTKVEGIWRYLNRLKISYLVRTESSFVDDVRNNATVMNSYSIIIFFIRIDDSMNHFFCVLKLNKDIYALNYYSYDTDMRRLGNNEWENIKNNFIKAYGIIKR